MYSDTCINRSCSKAETLLRRSDTFQLVCFFYASLLPISKGETVKWTLLQIDNFFQFSDKKAICFTRTQRKILGIPRNRELNWTFLLIFPKRNIFYFETTMILFDFILHFWRSKILLSQTLFLFFQVALCSQPAIVLRHWKRYRTGTFKPYSTPLWTIGFSTVTYIELWWSVKDLQRNALNFFFSMLFSLLLLTNQNTLKSIGWSR